MHWADSVICRNLSRQPLSVRRALLNADANPLAKDNIGRSCLLLALQSSKKDMFHLCALTIEAYDPALLRNALLDFGYTAHNAINIILASDEDDQDQSVEN